MTNPSSPPGRRALVVRGGWEGHSPVEITERFVPFLKEHGFTVETADSLDVYGEADRLAATDLVVQCWTMGEIAPELSRALAAAVRAGTGFAGWHGGVIDSFRGDLGYHLLTGGQFLMHPAEFVDYTVELGPGRAGHPVTEGWPTSASTPSSTGSQPTPTSMCSPPLRSRPTKSGNTPSSCRPCGPGPTAPGRSSCPRLGTRPTTSTYPRSDLSPNGGCRGRRMDRHAGSPPPAS